MKIKNIIRRKSSKNDKVYLTEVGSGFLQGKSGSLPDVDNDFQSDRRQEVKEYLENRYNKNGKSRVFSAGTLGTLQMKAIIKDVCDIYGVPKFIAPTVSKALQGIHKDTSTWSGLMQAAFLEKNQKNGKRKTVYNFISEYPEVIKDIRHLIGQPRSQGIHASAFIITPEHRDGEDVECFDFLPMRVVGGVLSSELDGVEIDDIGLLKNDVLGTIELTKVGEFFRVIKEHYGITYTIEDFAESNLDDEATFKILADGKTQGVFQFSGGGMTTFMQNMQPTRFEDFIAGTSLFRPAALESGSASKYNECKSGDMAPVYPWGTHDILGETYGVLAYQEQLAQMAREIGGFSIAEGVRLVKLISKKNTEKIHAMKDKFMDGALAKGCPIEDANKIWDMIESGGSYLFNKCISGDESIYRLTGGKFVPTIAEMYKIKNDAEYAKETNHTNLRYKYRSKKGYGYGFSLNEEGRLVKNKIVDIRYVGEKPMYKIHLDNGDSIKCTPNHKHPTNKGMVRTDMLKVNEDKMFINIGHTNQDTMCRFTDKHAGDSGLYTKMSTVVKIEYIGIEDAYDVEMDEPYHTFATFGNVVTCNSHATSYSVISYIGAYIKAHYPAVFYTVALELAKKEDVPKIMIEIGDEGSGVRITAPSINVSGFKFSGDYDTGNIYWSLSRIDQCGVATTNKVVEDREMLGDFESLEDFLIRGTVKKFLDRKVFEWAREKGEFVIDGMVFDTGMLARKHFENQPYSKLYELIIEKDLTEEQKKYVDDVVNRDSFAGAEVVRNMIFAGCFDEVEGVTAVTDRWGIAKRAHEFLGVEIEEKHYPSDLVNKHYFWSGKQIDVSGIGFVDYARVYRNSEASKRLKGKGVQLTLAEMALPENDGKRGVFCATISYISPKSYVDKKTGETKDYFKIGLVQNKEAIDITVWADAAAKFSDIFIPENVGKILIGNCAVRYSDWFKKNELQTQYSTEFYII